VTAAAEPPLIRALTGRHHGPPPLWMMRQAGRTLANYRALRAGTDFLSFCKDVDRAVEATLIPVRELGVDAAILFADIVLVAEAMGQHVAFQEGVGPVLSPALTDAAAVAALRPGEVAQTCAYVGQIVRGVRAALPAHVALIGFAPSPWTLAAYMVDGQGKRGFPALKRFAYGDPAGFAALLDTITDALIAYAHLQVDAGVQAFQIFDTWAELLSPALYAEVLAPRLNRLLAALDGVPRIYFPKGTAAFVEVAKTLPIEALGCDWTVDLADVRRRLGPDIALQGNLDPSVLLAPEPAIRAATHRMLDAMAGDPAYVVNLGHGLMPGIPEAHVHAFVDAVRAWTPQ